MTLTMFLTARFPGSGTGCPPTMNAMTDGDRAIQTAPGRTGTGGPEDGPARARAPTAALPKAPPAPEDPFDERNQLRDGWQTLIRRRIASTGVDDFPAQCYALADLIRTEDPVAIWALLLWNTGVSPELAGPLRDWIRQGMPLEPGRPHRGRPT